MYEPEFEMIVPEVLRALGVELLLPDPIDGISPFLVKLPLPGNPLGSVVPAVKKRVK